MQTLSPIQILEAFLSNENAIRKEAEAYLNALHQSNPIGSFNIYMAGIDLPRADVRNFFDMNDMINLILDC